MRLTNRQLAHEIITTMAIQPVAPGNIYDDGMQVILYQFDHAKAHPRLREIGEWCYRHNVKVGLTNPFEDD